MYFRFYIELYKKCYVWIIKADGLVSKNINYFHMFCISFGLRGVPPTLNAVYTTHSSAGTAEIILYFPTLVSNPFTENTLQRNIFV